MARSDPCIVCGEDTSTGSPLYSDRLIDRRSGTTRFLCSLCAQRARGNREIHDLTDDERRKLHEAAFLFGSFAPGGH